MKRNRKTQSRPKNKKTGDLRRRYTLPLAEFPVSAPGVGDLLAGIKKVFFANCPELFRFTLRTPQPMIPFDPLPDFVAPPDSARYIAPRMHYVSPNPFKLLGTIALLLCLLIPSATVSADLLDASLTRFSCFVQAVTVTTQCQAAPAAGLRNYISSFYSANQAATVQTLDIVYGTGANCATGLTALTHKFQFGTLQTTTNAFVVSALFPAPLIPNTATAICIRPTAATVFGATITGFIAP